MTYRQVIGKRTQCVGHACSERDGCMRYELRQNEPLWASFDIERQRFPGPCLHRVVVEERKVAHG